MLKRPDPCESRRRDDTAERHMPGAKKIVIYLAFLELIIGAAVIVSREGRLARLRRFDWLRLLKSGFCGQKALIYQHRCFPKRL